MSLDAEPEKSGVSVEGLSCSRIRQLFELVFGQDGVVGAPGSEAFADEFDGLPQWNCRYDLDRLGQEGTADPRSW